MALPNSKELYEYKMLIRDLNERFLNPISTGTEINELDYVKVTFCTNEDKLPTTEILKWLYSNTSGKFYIKFNLREIGFELPHEATLFALSFRHKVAQ